ncbi:gliding motility lipoprotein GldB [Labilibacter marinus]|uniref:gliding motility lipoprotein GldB n=1 Tax=Labilibacter marinus TaxID=1477105 RepID=UPI00117B0379|nr:gliding motility protein GldB [Labilibacter marinus]
MQNIMKLKYVVIILVLVLGAISCKDKTMHPEVSHINVELSVVPIYQEIHGMDTMKVEEEIKPILEKHPAFMQAYAHKIVKLGDPALPDFSKRLYDFVTYPANKDIFTKSKEVFPDFNDFEQELEEGFKHYKYYFPEATIPEIYLMISGFSQSIAVDSLWLGVSVEKYLGQDCEFYEWLDIYQYLRIGMVKEKMAPDVLRAIALTNYPNHPKVEDLINNMVYQGKMRYFVHRMFPDIKDTLLFDYTAEQMLWCNNHEPDMWASLVEWKHLFKEDRMMIQKYTGDAPFTSNFGNNSAPRAGEFIGYKIVESYMKKNEEVTLKQLMQETDGRKILAASNYRP